MTKPINKGTSLVKPEWLEPKARVIWSGMTQAEIAARVEDIESEIQWMYSFPRGTVEWMTEEILKLRRQQETLYRITPKSEGL